MKPQEFINRIVPGAQAAMESRGILASFSVAQAALESGWGVHTPCNNLFGIKAYGWSGATQLLDTIECIDGKTIKIKDTFRAYSSWNQSVDDHTAFIAKNNRYSNIIGVSDYKKVCRLIEQDGYATAKNYANQLIAVIEQYKLNQYDALTTKICIDAPTQGCVCTGNINIKGWAVCTDGISRIDVYADGKQGLASIRAFSERKDVNKAVNRFGWYKNAETSGFSCIIPAGKIAKGKHRIDIAAITSSGKVTWARKSVTVK